MRWFFLCVHFFFFFRGLFFYHRNGATFTVCCANVRMLTLFARPLRTVCKKKKKVLHVSLWISQCCETYSCDLLCWLHPWRLQSCLTGGKKWQNKFDSVFSKTLFTCLSWFIDKVIHGLPWQRIYSWPLHAGHFWSFCFWSAQVKLISFFSISSDVLTCYCVILDSSQ